MAGETATAMAFAERVERLALEAATFNRASTDKTEFIRIWVAARAFRGLPCDAEDWDAAMDSREAGRA
jgi:hypothetical protein